MNKEIGLKIKHQLELNGSSFSIIARKIDPPVSPQAVHRVAYVIRSTPRIRAAIAVAIGKKVSDLWPGSSQEISQSAPGSKQ